MEKEKEEKKDEQTLDWLLPDHVYDVLKWLGLIALPAVAWFVGAVGGDIGLDDPASVASVVNALGALIGILIGASALKGGGFGG